MRERPRGITPALSLFYLSRPAFSLSLTNTHSPSLSLPSLCSIPPSFPAQVSVFFEQPTLGMHLVPAAAAVRPVPDTGADPASNGIDRAPRTYVAPAIVSSVQNTEVR